MAKRSTRRRIIDHLERAMRELDQAENQLAIVSSVYAQANAHQGATVDIMRNSLTVTRDAVRAFRYGHA